MLLDTARRGHPVPTRLLHQLADSGDPALFRDLVEPLCDSFDPASCEAYVSLFPEIIAHLTPEYSSAALRERYARVRRPRLFQGPDPDDIYVLSRVTLGADIAVTSTVLDAMKKRFPSARVHFVGSTRNFELLSGDPRIHYVPAPYARAGTVASRIEAGLALKDVLGKGIVIDPDSRLTQLGLLPICPEEQYFFFESRSYHQESTCNLATLTAQWLEEAFGVAGARPYLAPSGPKIEAQITLSLGVGENPNKRIADPFESELIRNLVSRGLHLLIDYGAGGEESERVERAIAAANAHPGQIQTWRGAFAPFAASILASRLYIGYDSAGQHVASAGGVPHVTVFAGAVNDRFFERWRTGGRTIRVHNANPAPVLLETLSAVDEMLRG